MSPTGSEACIKRRKLCPSCSFELQRATRDLDDFHRKGQAQRTSLSLDDLPEIASDETPIEQKLFMKERFKLLREVISSLAPRAQEVITLRFFGELSNQEIAEVLGVEQRTVSGYLTRGLRDLEARYLLRIVDQTREESHHGDR